MRARVARVFMCAALCLLGMGTSLWAQSDVASVTGRVLDPNGAVIIEATVTARNVDTGVATVIQTNQEGVYSFANLNPGNYEFTVSKKGFKEIEKPGVTLHLADNISMNFNMVVGELSQKITVEAGASMINTTDASLSTVVDQTYIKNMPLNGRSLQDLILLAPGVVTTTPQVANAGTNVGSTGEFSVDGQRTESNYFTVDGVSGSVGTAAGRVFVGNATASGSLPAETALGTTQALVSVDELQEFRVSTSTYSAENGRNPGAQIAFQTKSGTNQWHGTAYDYLRNGFFDARDWFNNYVGVAEPPLHQNDFGGTLGGAIQKDKTFFFTSYEGLRLHAPQPATINVVVPDNCLRGIDATSCQAGETAAPAALLPALNGYPLPSANGVNFLDGTAQYIASWLNPGSIDSGSLRLDHVMKDKMRFFFRFNQTDSSSGQRGFGALTPSTNQITDYTIRTYTGGATTLFSTRWTNDLRINYASNETTYDAFIDPIGGSQPVDIAALSGLTTGAQFSLNFHGSQAHALSQDHWTGVQNQWNLVDTVSYTVGKHQLKFGADYRRLASHFAVENVVAAYAFLDPSFVDSNTAFINVGENRPGYPLYKNFSAFAEDEWRVTPRLSVSMGLRWEVNPPPSVTQGQAPYTLMGSDPNTAQVAPLGTPLWHTTWYNFAPRLGAAYVIRSTPSWETVVRAGGGVFFDSGQQDGGYAFQGPGFFSSGFQAAAFPIDAPSSAPPICDPAQPTCTGYFGVGYEPHLQLPYTIQWNTSIEQALGKSQMLTVSYVGSHASRLLQWNWFFPPSNPNTFFINHIGNGLTADYQSLQTQFQRRLSGGLTALGSYTWSHCSDYGSFNASLGWQRADCDFDVRHNFSAALSYDLPNAGHSRLANALLHNWGLDNRFTARTAFPINLVGFGNFNPVTGQNLNNGLDFVPGVPVLIYGANCDSIMQAAGALGPNQGCPGGIGINPNAFTPASDQGQTPRNFLRLFGAWQMDMAVRREFPIRENLKLQFRAEAFNIFNHPNFGAVDSAFGDTTFGLITGTLSTSLGVLSPLYQMGGPRSMQFALKLIF